VVIGPGGRDIAAADAHRAVAGYAVANDLSSRDNQRSESQWIRSKSFDGFCPLGPWITTSEDVADPANLRLTTDVNGERRQDSNTSQMLFGVPELIEYLSHGISLLPGDVILTGTPSGVGVGMEPPRFLRPGDVVRCEIEHLGHLENTMVAP
jgi:2-keto-4-pentenoate hydratase/2-oxohepta-3-ene-1,7-dioic acid hydratase in catechol pathway